jgi:hypothetical protein
MIQAFKNKNKIQHEVQKDTGRYKWHKNLFILAILKIDHYILIRQFCTMLTNLYNSSLFSVELVKDFNISVVNALLRLIAVTFRTHQCIKLLIKSSKLICERRVTWWGHSICFQILPLLLLGPQHSLFNLWEVRGIYNPLEAVRGIWVPLKC